MPPCWLFVFPGNMVSFFAYRYYTMLSTLHTSLLVYLLDHGGLGGVAPQIGGKRPRPGYRFAAALGGARQELVLQVNTTPPIQLISAR